MLISSVSLKIHAEQKEVELKTLQHLQPPPPASAHRLLLRLLEGGEMEFTKYFTLHHLLAIFKPSVPSHELVWLLRHTRVVTRAGFQTENPRSSCVSLSLTSFEALRK